MKRTLIVAAFAALSTFSASGTAFAALTPEEHEICNVLDLAGESTCDEFEATKPYRMQQQAAGMPAELLEDAMETRGVVCGDPKPIVEAVEVCR